MPESFVSPRMTKSTQDNCLQMARIPQKKGTHLLVRKLSLESKCKSHRATIPLGKGKLITIWLAPSFTSPLPKPNPFHQTGGIDHSQYAKTWKNTNKLHVVTCLEKNFTASKIKKDKISRFYLVTQWLVGSLRCSAMKTTVKWIKTEVHRGQKKVWR